jgi:putative aldouronate transport system permease protein
MGGERIMVKGRPIRTPGSGEFLFHFVNNTFMLILCVISIFPFFYVISVSLTPTTDYIRNGGFLIIPQNITFEAYQFILEDRLIPRAFFVSVIVTLLGTAVSLAATVLMAFPLSVKTLLGRNAIVFGVVFTMMFTGGMIPTYIVVKELGLLNTISSLILPGMINAFNLILMKTFFENLPEEMVEAARIDGCSDWGILRHVIIPLSKAIMATIGLFYAVTYWNIYFQALLYISDSKLFPLQVVLQNLLNGVQELEQQFELIVEVPTEAFKMAAIVISIIPMLCIYPWLQKYFTKGVMLGSIKG